LWLVEEITFLILLRIRILVLCALAVVLIACVKTPKYPEASRKGDSVIIELAKLQEARPVFFTFTHEGKRINFLVLRIGGEIQSYLDACAKCYPKKLGYRPVDGRLQCMACGEQYPLDELKGVGSCYPLPLEGEVQDDGYVIKIEDIIKGRRYF
jgi:uncharacterized membrane protein